jgi:MFS family permease
MRRRLGRAFYTAAALDGMMFGVLALSVPMHIEALGRPASLAGEVLATGTVTVAGGALVAGRVGRLVGGGRNLLAAALAVSGLGEILLFLASAAPAMAAGSGLVGGGIGLFWVASQTLLGEASGEPGSERAFATHYAAYTFGVAGGSTGAGLVIALLRDAGVGAVTASRYSYVLGIVAAALAVAVWRPARRESVPAGPHARLSSGLSPRGVAIQVPDLLLVAALALLLPLAPIVLAGRFHLAPLVVGITVGGVQAAKIGGAFAGRILTESGGHRRAVLLLLIAAAVLSALLAAAVLVGQAGIFVTVLVGTAFVATGGVAADRRFRARPHRAVPPPERHHRLERVRVRRDRRRHGQLGLDPRRGRQPAGAVRARRSPAGRRRVVRVGGPAVAGARAGGLVGSGLECGACRPRTTRPSSPSCPTSAPPTTSPASATASSTCSAPGPR